ncbi:MAG: four helix bundle protein [Bacteroidales bacterium]
MKNRIWKLTKRFPKEELYKLTDQIIRASRSVTANIAEGYGRFHFQENIQYCRQARGSLYEVIDHFITAYDCEYINEDELNDFRNESLNCLKILNGYIAYLKRAKDGKTTTQ